MAIISLITSLTIPFPLVPIVFGHLARSEIRKSNGSITGAGIALAGLILGYLQIFIILFIIILFTWINWNLYKKPEETMPEETIKPQLSSIGEINQESRPVDVIPHIRKYSGSSGKETTIKESKVSAFSKTVRSYDLNKIVGLLGGDLKSQYITISLKLESFDLNFESLMDTHWKMFHEEVYKIIQSYEWKDAVRNEFKQVILEEIKTKFQEITEQNKEFGKDFISNVYVIDLYKNISDTEPSVSHSISPFEKPKFSSNNSRYFKNTLESEHSSNSLPNVSENQSQKILTWAIQNANSIFPTSIRTKISISLKDSSNSVKIPSEPGHSLSAVCFHPNSSQFLIVEQPFNKRFKAVLKIEDSNFIDILKTKYETDLLEEIALRWIKSGPRIASLEIHNLRQQRKFEHALAIFELLKNEHKALIIAYMLNSNQDTMIELADALAIRDRGLLPRTPY